MCIMEVLVVGLGSMGKRRIRLLKQFKHITNIVGIDNREDRREEAVHCLNCNVCENINQALEQYPNIECAFICTSPLTHSRLITSVLNYNLHVFTEINLVDDGYENNMKLASEKKKVLFLSSTFYYREEIQYIRKGILGKNKLNYVYHIGQYLPDWHPWENYQNFFVGNKRTNACREIMAIELPWLTGTFGSVNNVHVIADNISGLRIQYPDNYMIQIEHEHGNKGILVIDVVSPKAVRNLEVYGEGVYYSWNGLPDSLEYYDQGSKQIKKVKMEENEEHIDGYNKFILENAYHNEIREFFKAIDDGMIPRYGFEQDLEVLKLIDRIEAVNG